LLLSTLLKNWNVSTCSAVDNGPQPTVSHVSSGLPRLAGAVKAAQPSFRSRRRRRRAARLPAAQSTRRLSRTAVVDGGVAVVVDDVHEGVPSHKNGSPEVPISP
jgi:hypothetical protein